jgi:alpha-tubulin suppressor-like RCC1 family protein
MFLSNEYRVYGAGSNSYHQLCSLNGSGIIIHASTYDPLRVIKVVCGYYHTILVTCNFHF